MDKYRIFTMLEIKLSDKREVLKRNMWGEIILK